MDTREARIVFQNALAHATKLAIHNSRGEKVDPLEVVELAKIIAREVAKIGQAK